MIYDSRRYRVCVEQGRPIYATDKLAHETYYDRALMLAPFSDVKTRQMHAYGTPLSSEEMMALLARCRLGV